LSLTVLFIIAVVAGFYMAWNIGANDVANAMGTPVGSGALTLKQAVVLAGIFEFLGAFLVGSSVAETVKHGIIPSELFAGEPIAFGIGMLSALLAAAIWLNVATCLGQPVSTTHAIIGAVVGFALVSPLAGAGNIQWNEMLSMAGAWIVSPLVGGTLAFLSYVAIRRFVLNSRHPVYRARAAVPLGFGATITLIGLSITFRGLKGLNLDMGFWSALAISSGAGLAAYLLSRAVVRHHYRRTRVRQRERYMLVERWFSRLQVVTACYMAFAHGANDVANAVGPLAGCIQAFNPFGEGAAPGQATVSIPPWLLALGGVGIVIGLATYGYKVIEAVGKKITEITPTRGFSAEFGTASTVLLCSKLGFPISTTFVLVGAVMGVGIARGFGSIDMRVIGRIFASWVITIPASALLAAGLYLLLAHFAL
jgi:PiT family inorganic phosphate transporter